MLVKSRVSGLHNTIYRTKAALFDPLLDIIVPRFHNILVVKRRVNGDLLCSLTHNLVTINGDIYYAQLQAQEATTNAYDSLYLSESNWDATHPNKNSGSNDLADVIAGAEKLVTASYPRTNDPDSDNTGSGLNVLTWQFAYSAADFNSVGIEAGALAEPGVTSWGGLPGSDTVLTAFDLATTPKQATDTLKIIINHTQNGV